MASNRLRRPGRAGRPVRRSNPFTPTILALEDRSVPSTFYVDPSWEGSGSFSSVTFNKDYPGQRSGLVYGADIVDYTASPTTVNAFSDLALALQVSEQNPGPDTILIAHSADPIVLKNTATQLVGTDLINSVPITQPLTLSGSGAGATVIVPLIDTEANALADDTVALFRVAGSGANLSVSGLTLDGFGHKLGAGFLVRDGAATTFDGMTIRNIAFDVSDGTAIVGFGAGNLTVQNTEISGYGRSGVVFQNTDGKVAGATIVGSGQTGVINNGVEVLDDSTVLITGSTISGNLGRQGGADSAGVLVAAAAGTTPRATLYGNSIYGNAVGLLIGEAADDPSVVVANFNNIAANDIGVDARLATNTVDARFNFWGSASGPFESGSNPTGAGNPVLGLVNFLPTLPVATPALSTTSTVDYLAQIATIGANVALASGQAATVTHAATSADKASFQVTFAQSVTGFGSEDVTVSGTPVPAGGATVSVTGSGTTYTVTVSGLSGSGAVNLSVKPNGATGPLGFQNAASNTATVTFANATVGATVALAAGQVATVPHSATAADTATFAVTFTQAVTGFAADDLTVTGGVVPAGGATVSVSGSGASYTVTVSGLSGTGSVNVSVNAGAVTGPLGETNPASNTATVAFSPTVVNRVQIMAAGPDTGGAPFVQTYNANGTAGAKFLAFEATFSGGVRVATGDVNGDGFEDVVVGPGVGGGPRVRVFSGKDGTVLADFFAYESTVRDGTYVAVGDLDGDGKGEVIVGAGIGGGPAVAVFGYGSTASGAGLIERYRFFAFENTARGGVLVAAGDVNGDGKDEIIAGAGVGGAPAVAVFNGDNGSERYRFFAYSSSVRSGVFVAAGDLDGDGKDEIVAGVGFGGGPQVRTVRGIDGTDLGSFFAYDPAVRGGVRVAVGDVTGDGRAEVITGPGLGGGPNVRGFDPLTSTSPVFSVFAFDPAFTGGVFVG